MYQHAALISALFILITVLFLYKMKDYQNSNETKLLLLKVNDFGMNLHNLEKTIIEKLDQVGEKLDTDITVEIEDIVIENLQKIIERNSATAKQEKWVQHLKDKTFKKVFSQNNEDGALEAVFFHIGVTDKVYVEFGVEDCTECNSRYLRCMVVDI